MIRAIVFDMGNVLLRFQPQLVSRLCTENEADAQQLYAGLFQSPEWAMTDSGALSDPEFLERVIPRLPPHLQEAGRRAFACWGQYLPPVPGMEELLRGLKAAGYRLYVCSNASRRFFSYTTPLPMFSLFDGILVSAVEGCVKPDPAIYQRLFARFSLDPSQCLFIDDLPANIQGGRACGMEGIVFDGEVAHLRQSLAQLGVRPAATEPTTTK